MIGVLGGNGSKLHEDKIVRGHKIARRYFCTNGNFERVTILHEGSVLHKSKKKTEKKLKD